ncbi:hypothetical protein FRC06_007372 [Ceratobasidium sp. 370]|nr:hypothetical protein FRC06_007372 [Ceratobasidium sp. 370]
MSRIHLALRRALQTATTRRFASTHVAVVLHDAIGVDIPRRQRPVILPGDVGYAYNDLLVALRDQLEFGRPESVYAAFLRLQSAGHADHLGPHDLQAIDAAISPTVWRPVSKHSVLRSFKRLPAQTYRPVAAPEQVRELALWLALRGQIGLLRSCMIHSLRESNPNTVIDLWHAYAKRSLAGEGVKFLEELPHPAPQLSKPDTDTDPDQPTLLRYYPGRPELLALTLCAYTMLADFRSAFHTAFATLVPIKPGPTRDALEPLIDLHEKAVFDTLQAAADINTLRSLARPASLRNHLAKAVASKTESRVQRVWDELVRLLRAPEPWIGPLDDSGRAPTVSTEPDARPLFSVSRQTWCDLLEAAAALRPLVPSLTQSIWAELYALNVKPTTGMWNALMAGYATYGDFTRAWAIWDEIGPERRDAYTYTSMIQALFEYRKVDRAITMFEELKTVSRGKGEELGIRPYNVLLHGLFSVGRIQSALDLLTQIESSSSLAPDTTTYNTQLRFYARKRDMVELSKVLKNMAERKITADVYTFVTVLDALLGIGAKDAAGRILEIMRALQVEPNAALVSALVEDVIRARPVKENQKDYISPSSNPDGPTPAERLHIAVKMLLAFEKAGVETNVVNYTSLMAAFQRAAVAHDIPHGEARTAIKALRARMKQRNIVPNRVTFNTLITAALGGGPVPPDQWGKDVPPWNPARVDRSSVPPNVSQAVEYLHELRGAEILPNHDTWYVLLKGVASWGQTNLARVLCDEMMESGFVPQTSLLKLVMKIRGGG